MVSVGRGHTMVRGLDREQDRGTYYRDVAAAENGAGMIVHGVDEPGACRYATWLVWKKLDSLASRRSRLSCRSSAQFDAMARHFLADYERSKGSFLPFCI